MTGRSWRRAATTAVAAACAVLFVAACGGDDGADTRVEGAAEDVRALAAQLESAHPDLFHAVSRAEFRRATDELAARAGELGRDRLLVELMRLAALPGTRDGHTGIFPLDAGHRRPLHLLPLRLYRFADGFHVVGEVGQLGLVGARVRSLGSVRVEEAAARVRPLVPADNAWSARARVAQWLVVAEVLRGTGIADAGAIEVELELDGRTRTVALEPVPAPRWREAFPDLFHPMVPQGLPRRPAPDYLARREEPGWTALLDRGRVAYAALNVTLGDAGARVAAELEGLARRPGVERVVLDLRHNPGGDTFTYVALLDVLRRLEAERPGRLRVLVSRTTFSAAANLCADLEREAGAVFVGEPTGGSPNLYGDPVERRLERTGLVVHAAAVHWEKGGPGDSRLAFQPDVRVPLTARAFFARLDPVLERATGDGH